MYIYGQDHPCLIHNKSIKPEVVGRRRVNYNVYFYFTDFTNHQVHGTQVRGHDPNPNKIR